MKRAYAAGDWFAIPLGAGRYAPGIVARQAGSRLFGYLFAPRAGMPDTRELHALRGVDALWCGLFAATAIEDARWPLLGRASAFDPAEWPFPDFALRGSFGESWTRRTYDEHTLRALRTTALESGDARALPDARFAQPELLERRLRGRYLERLTVYEVRTPLDPQRLTVLAEGGRLQFSTPLRPAELAALAEFLRGHPHVTLRVHGFVREPFDARTLRRFEGLRQLRLDAASVREFGALTALRDSLVELALSAAASQAAGRELGSLERLEVLELRGAMPASVDLAAWQSLRCLTVVDAPSHDARFAAALGRLESLQLFGGSFADLAALAALESLERLSLRHLSALEHLPAMGGLKRLRTLQLAALPRVASLQEVTRAPALESLEISGMEHLNVGDLRILAACRQLCEARIDIGGRRKNREVYRLLREAAHAQASVQVCFPAARKPSP